MTMSKKTPKPTPKPKPKGSRKAATKAALKATSLQSDKAMSRPQLPKSPTGIHGFDEITGGGLPTGRTTLITGGAGCGKSVFAMEFLVKGANLYDEPGVMMSFQESEEELISNVASLGFDLKDLIRRKKLLIETVRVDNSEFETAGKYDLEGLFIRLGHDIESIGAKRVVLDSVESILANVANTPLVRSEMRRLFHWLKMQGVTAIITAEAGNEMLTREGLEEYISDCVINLDNRITDQTSSRRLRVIKYRGSAHGSNEYPFLIDVDGFSVLPVTSAYMNHPISTRRVPTGVERLDTMLGGKGYYQGSSVLVSGTAGTGKSSLASHFVDAACSRGQRAIYFTFEEASDQIIRNMASIGIDLQYWVKKGLLQFVANRPSTYDLEKHLLLMQRAITEFDPAIVTVDPVNSFLLGSNQKDVKGMLMRLVNFMKMRGITSLFTSLTGGGSPLEQTDIRISSLIDTWILVRDMDCGGERNRTLCIVKSRGMSHSNQIREFLLTNHGVDLLNVYIGPSGVLTGTARSNQEAIDMAAELLRNQEIIRSREELTGKRSIMEATIAAKRAEFEVEALASKKIMDLQQGIESVAVRQRQLMALARGEDLVSPGARPRTPTRVKPRLSS